MTVAIWTAVVCGGYAAPDATRCTAVIGVERTVASEEGASDQSLRRTSEAGHWPIMPPIPGPKLVLEPRRALESMPTSSTGSEGRRSAGHEGSAESGPSPLTPTAIGATGTTIADAESGSAKVPGLPLPLPVANANASVSADATPPDLRGLTPVEGGWLSPDHRRAPRELVLISIEQANRTPALFFEGGGAHRVYVPTDPIFDEASSTLRAEAPLVLARVAALLSLESQARLLLEVHSDAAGAPENQIELTRRRAEIVRSWLVDRGHILPNRFEMRAIGGSRPLVPPDGNYAAQQPNRRIEIRLGEGD